MTKYFWLLLLGSLFWTFDACRENTPHRTTPPEVSGTQTDDSAPSENSLLTTRALVSIDYLRVRRQPDLKAEEIGHLRLGETVPLTGEITQFTSSVRLRGLAYQDPWVGVSLPDGKRGWVYGGGLSFRGMEQSVLAETLIQKRLGYFLNPSLAEEMQAYASSFRWSACDSTAFAERQQKALVLQKQIEKALNRHFSAGASADLPDFYWLELNFPTFFVQYDRQSRRLRIFQDYKALAREAKRCPGTTDDALVAWYFSLYPQDSLEADFPVYLLDDREQNNRYNTLGDGKTLPVLKRMNELYTSSDLYDDLLLHWKDRWLNDLKNPNLPFWHAPEDVHSEINAILGLNSPLFTEEERFFLRSLPVGE